MKAACKSTNRFVASTLYDELRSLSPGLTTKEVLEQSSCLAFDKGWIHSFNDEIHCRRKSPIRMRGAVPGQVLLNAVRSYDAREIEIQVQANRLVLNDGHVRQSIAYHPEVALAYGKAESPKSWKSLPEGFAKGLTEVLKCCGKDESQYTSTCVHFHPEFIEACDNHQGARYAIRLGLDSDFIVRGASLKQALKLRPTKFCLTANWLHFADDIGAVFSCRRDLHDYEPLDELLDAKGVAFSWPPEIARIAKEALHLAKLRLFSNEVTVTLDNGTLSVSVDTEGHEFSTSLPTEYTGPNRVFTMGPLLLTQMTGSRRSNWILGENRMLWKQGPLSYVVATGVPE